MPQPVEASFRLASPARQFKLALSDPPRPPQSLGEKYRPRMLADVVGQGPAVFRLESFLEAPYSAAFLFEGPTGVGKTTVALILASELGAVEFGGLEVIKSGTQDAEAVETVLRSLRFTPMMGSGWKVVIVDEADYMSPKAAQLWLSALEDLPARSLVIFTTNNPDKFPDRFRDRCERFDFGGGTAFDAQALARKVWKSEIGIGPAPNIDSLSDVFDKFGQLSYRRVIRALEVKIAEHLAGKRRKPAAKPGATETVVRGRDLDSIDWHTVADRYRSGVGLTDLSKDLGVPATSIHGRLRKIGVEFNQRKRGAR